MFITQLALFSQGALQISYTKLGKLKKFEIFTRETLEYKVKGSYKQKINKISAIGDSIIYFTDETEINFKQLKSLRLHKNNHLLLTLQHAFIISGCAILTLDVANSFILERPEILNKKALIVSTAFIATGFIMKRLGVIKLRINRHKVLKHIYTDYNNLNNTK